MKRCFIILLLLLCCGQIRSQQVNTVAGIVDTPGAVDSISFFALFNNPHGIAIHDDGTIYIADRFNHVIRKYVPGGNVTTFAGTPGIIGSQDGIGTNARFYEPWDIDIDSQGNVYVADYKNNRIRKIRPNGLVTTIAGSGSFGYADNNFGLAASFGNPSGVAVTDDGTIYVADHNTHLIRKITSQGAVSTMAGSKEGFPNNFGAEDGFGASARFYRPYGITLDNEGNLIIADEWNHKIRKLTPTGLVTTIAGNSQIGNSDGSYVEASFNFPWDVAVDSAGNIYIADGYNYVLRRLTPEGMVDTYVGDAGTTGATDGYADEASFNGATGLVYSPIRNSIFVSDAYNELIREVLIGVRVLPDPSLLINKIEFCDDSIGHVSIEPKEFDRYEFFIDNEKNSTNQTGEFTFESLAPGNHTIFCRAYFGLDFKATSNQSIYIHPPLSASVTYEGPFKPYVGDSVVLKSDDELTIIWNTEDSINDITVFEDGDYTYTAWDINGCKTYSDTISVHFTIPLPHAVLIPGRSSTLCIGDSYTAQSNLELPITWYKDGSVFLDNSTLLTTFEAGTYYFIYTMGDGRVSFSDSVRITLHEYPEANFSADPRFLIRLDNEVNFTNLSTGATSYSWNFGDPESGTLTNSSTIKNPKHIYDFNGVFDISLTATNEVGCSHTEIKENYIEFLPELFLPTAFSPNGDGSNDKFILRGGNIESVHMEIFNQWGQKIFETDDKEEGWDGTVNHTQVQPSTFVFLVQYTDRQGEENILKGLVTIIE